MRSPRAAPPPDITASWDLDGLDATLPGAGLTLRDGAVTVAGLGGLLAIFLAVVILVAASTQGTWGSPEMWIGLGCVVPAVPFFILPFLGLGALRARGTKMHIRIEPDGTISHRWLGETVLYRTADIQSIAVPEDGAPRVVFEVSNGRGTITWRLRSQEHAEWMADQLRAAVQHRSSRQGASEDAPEALAQLRASERSRE